MGTVAEHLSEYSTKLGEGVKLIAVSKLQPNKAIEEAYAAGQRSFGENYVQELCDKRELLPTDIEWHFIGHLQSNKVKYIAPFVSYIHGVDSLSLLEKINQAAAKHNRQIFCLLQLHVAKEETKHGLSPDEAIALASDPSIKNMANIILCGVMGMASFTSDRDLIRKEFKEIKSTFDQLKPLFGPEFSEISMGMSSDWDLALEEGSTMVRIGSAIFGERKK
jgi:pyridoxal phosphate enzyme (YggS family)